MDRGASSSYIHSWAHTMYKALLKQEQKHFLLDSGIVLMNMPLERGKITENRRSYRNTYDHTAQSFCGKASTQGYKHGFQTLILPVMFPMCFRDSPELRGADLRGWGGRFKQVSSSDKFNQVSPF